MCESNICLRKHPFIKDAQYFSLRVLAAHCKNDTRDNGESDVDCGGPCAFGLKCNVSQACNVSCDCVSDVCVSNICLRKHLTSCNIKYRILLVLASHCNDGTQDYDETGVDCGGGCAEKRKCSNFVRCRNGRDCISNSCNGGICGMPWLLLYK